MKLVTANDLHIPREHKLVAYQPVVQVWIRRQKRLRYPQRLFVESRYGDGQA